MVGWRIRVLALVSARTPMPNSRNAALFGDKRRAARLCRGSDQSRRRGADARGDAGL
jgi:hypothetical protein